MSMMGELKFFLGFQVRQLAKGTFISQEKNVKEMLKKFNMTNASPMKTPMPIQGQLGSCDGEKDVDIKRSRLRTEGLPEQEQLFRRRDTAAQLGADAKKQAWLAKYATTPVHEAQLLLPPPRIRSAQSEDQFGIPPKKKIIGFTPSR
ncbi:hypothetical protein QYE76_017628 [Lolium multiflorum]|uniref:Uncharacterized protein n=1 Tax=Lolium multiflorum TaxID=4521 RepID=A0AAD8QC57_LOLMU|nr:hypothetical protein QYE76_017628 [Lolium multiflorum]